MRCQRNLEFPRNGNPFIRFAPKREVESFRDDNSVEIPLISNLGLNKEHIENNVLFTTAIIGNPDSEVANMIEQLGNAGWVKQGLGYLPQNHLLKQKRLDALFAKKKRSHLMRWQYDQTLSRFEQDQKTYTQKDDELRKFLPLAQI